MKNILRRMFAPRLEMLGCSISYTNEAGAPKITDIGNAKRLEWTDGKLLILLDGEVVRIFVPRSSKGYIGVFAGLASIAHAEADYAWTKKEGELPKEPYEFEILDCTIRCSGDVGMPFGYTRGGLKLNKDNASMVWPNGTDLTILARSTIMLTGFPKGASGWIDVIHTDTKVNLAGANGDRCWSNAPRMDELAEELSVQ